MCKYDFGMGVHVQCLERREWRILAEEKNDVTKAKLEERGKQNIRTNIGCVRTMQIGEER